MAAGIVCANRDILNKNKVPRAAENLEQLRMCLMTFLYTQNMEVLIWFWGYFVLQMHTKVSLLIKIVFSCFYCVLFCVTY